MGHFTEEKMKAQREFLSQTERGGAGIQTQVA